MAGHLQVLAMFDVGSGEMMVIAIIALMVFGRRLPEVARSLGKSVNEFKKGMREFQDSANDVASDVQKAAGDAMSESDIHADQTTYEGSPSTYDNPTESPMTGEPAPESDRNPLAVDSTSDAAVPVNPTEPSPSPSASTDVSHTEQQRETPRQPDAAGTYEPMA
jgi:sec-independent protein translocase protein TatA